MESDGIVCSVFIQNEQLEQMDAFPYLGSLITEDDECTTEFRTRLNRGKAIGASLQKIWKSKVKIKQSRAFSIILAFTATWNSYMPYGSTHCYLPGCHLTKVRILQPKQVLDLATPEGCKAELSCVT